MRSNRDITPARVAGFTLVEVLVATAVLSIVVVMLAQVTGFVSEAWSSGTGRAERRQGGRALVDFIGRELRAAALPVDARSNAVSPDLQMVVNPSSVPEQYCQPSAIFWQAPLASDTSRGSMAEIGYFVRWDDAAFPPRASLCRVFINPGSTNHRVYEGLEWMTEDILSAAAPADEASGYRGLFAEHVIGFWARALDARGNPIDQGTAGAFDSRRNYTDTDFDAEGALVSVPRTAPVLPTSVEISIVLLDTRAASRLTAPVVERIKSLAKASNSAGSFVMEAERDASMRRIISGMSAQTLKVFLENAP